MAKSWFVYRTLVSALRPQSFIASSTCLRASKMGTCSAVAGWGSGSRCRASWRLSMAAASVCIAMGRDWVLSLCLHCRSMWAAAWQRSILAPLLFSRCSKRECSISRHLTLCGYCGRSKADFRVVRRRFRTSQAEGEELGVISVAYAGTIGSTVVGTGADRAGFYAHHDCVGDDLSSPTPIASSALLAFNRISFLQILSVAHDRNDHQGMGGCSPQASRTGLV